jgi:hypothetical protein
MQINSPMKEGHIMLIEWLYQLKESIDKHGIRFGVIFALYAIYRKERRNARLDQRDADVFHNQRVIMEKLGVVDQWRGQASPFQSEEVKSFKKLYSLLRKETQSEYPQRRKKTMMKALTSSISKKLIAFLVAAGVTSLNTKLGLDLNADTIYGLIALAIAYIAGQSHVDAKKAISNAVNNAATAVIEAADTTDGTLITTITAPPMSYEKMIPYVNKVHTDLTKLFEE